MAGRSRVIKVFAENEKILEQRIKKLLAKNRKLEKELTELKRYKSSLDAFMEG